METNSNSSAAHRRRLFEGMAHAVATSGYSACTITDIVREAAVSRRTFYEHFATKADCLIALYESASHHALRELRSSIDPQRGWESQLESAMVSYLHSLSANPKLLRTLFIDILGLGTAGLAARRRVNHEIADFVLEVINPTHDQAIMSKTMAMAVVGGINELVLELIEQDRIQDIPSITTTTSALIRAVVGVKA